MKFCGKAAVHGLILTCVLPLISWTPPSSHCLTLPLTLHPKSPSPSSHPTHPCCRPTTSILYTTLQSSHPPLTPYNLPTLPADGEHEHELTSDDGSTLSQSLSLTQSPQSTPAKEGITHPERERETLCPNDPHCMAVCVSLRSCVWVCVHESAY